jgi:hypothetical protein
LASTVNACRPAPIALTTSGSAISSEAGSEIFHVFRASESHCNTCAALLPCCVKTGLSASSNNEPPSP